MGGKRKRNLVAPGSSINKTPRPLPTQYDFVSKAKTSNLPPVVLPNKNPAPSVRDYPPPRQLFPCSTFQPSGSAPSTFCNDRGDLFGIGSLKKKLKRKPNDPISSYSFMHMQQKLEEAELKIKEQEARIAKAEADRALEQATNQAKMAEFSLMHKYMRSTDQKYLDFIASEASSPAPPDQ
ncbi:hypothetical protein HID58_044264 [Brassica napus]|uniref:No apical meristem-associated C-terminal domain-containing protein n=1 Tax=Brassica napus TaxID=3708 RepID=A0ABQ8BKR8_BRANA|nr:hypothetical protein HID58_044264 [Brassica napus]